MSREYPAWTPERSAKRHLDSATFKLQQAREAMAQMDPAFLEAVDGLLQRIEQLYLDVESMEAKR